jgi:glycosyltransferase involved in cell wall biosynthesis
MQKILVSAYACSPFRGSEPGVGWGYVFALSKFYSVTVITEENEFRDDIERYKAKYPKECKNLEFIYIPRYSLPLENYFKPVYYASYRKWHKTVYEFVKNDADLDNYSIVHQLNMVGFREPGYLWKLNIIFVWGPLGGMGYFPWTFIPKLPLINGIGYTVYNIVNYIQMRFSRRVLSAAKIAFKNNALIVANKQNAYYCKRYLKCAPHVLSEVGISTIINPKINKRSPDKVMRLIWVGLFIPRKNLATLIDAIEILKNLNICVDVYGAGPGFKKYKSLIDKKNLNNKIHLHGWVDRQTVLNSMKRSHAIVITSLRDLTSTVLIEAMSAGLPIMAPAHCGFADIVNQKNGYLLDVKSSKTMLSSLVMAITNMYNDEQNRLLLSSQASLDAENYLWKNKVEKLCAIYNNIHEKNSKKN